MGLRCDRDDCLFACCRPTYVIACCVLAGIAVVVVSPLSLFLSEDVLDCPGLGPCFADETTRGLFYAWVVFGGVAACVLCACCCCIPSTEPSPLPTASFATRLLLRFATDRRTVSLNDATFCATS